MKTYTLYQLIDREWVPTRNTTANSRRSAIAFFGVTSEQGVDQQPWKVRKDGKF